MSAPYLITGAVIPNTLASLALPQRLDICDLKDKKHQFTLYILSWQKIMQPGFRPAPASFQEIAGIHGMPYRPWLGDPDEARQADRGPYLGYCNHRSILFPTWHRPHLLLLEQIISDVAHGIAGEFAIEDPKEAKEWLQAAEDLRLPFWDWTHPRTGQSGIPEFLTTPEIWLYKPGGKNEKCNNPLHSYQFTEQVDGFDNRFMSNRIYKQPARAYFKQWDRTYRNPDSRPYDVTEDYGQINARLTSKKLEFSLANFTFKWEQGSWAQLTNIVAQTFAFPIDIPQNLWANAWDEFSNTTRQSARIPGEKDPKPRWNATSLEQSHNTVHVVLGGIGNMSDNDTAGYDPIFYLHHCNVDRLLSFWQHIYPDYAAGTEGYLPRDVRDRRPFTQGGGTWILTDDQKVDENSPLLPFRNDDYKHWTSKSASSLNYYRDGDGPNKYYTYPPIVVKVGPKDVPIHINTDPDVRIPPEIRSKQRRYLQEHFQYNPLWERKNSPLIHQEIFKRECPYMKADVELDRGREPIDNFRQFVISASADPTLIEGSHSVVLSFKIPSTEPGGHEEVYEIGELTVLSRGGSERCGNCRAQQQAGGVRVHGIILVPHQLVALALHNAHLDIEGAETDKALELVESCLQAALRLPNGSIYGSLSSDSSSQDKTYLTNDKTPSLHLMSCDVYLQLGEETRGATLEDKEKAAQHVPFDFDDWKVHDPLTQMRGGIKQTWVLHED